MQRFIFRTKNCRTCNLKDVNIHVNSPDMNGMRISGSGSIYAENDIQTDDMELKVSGRVKALIRISIVFTMLNEKVA